MHDRVEKDRYRERQREIETNSDAGKMELVGERERGGEKERRKKSKTIEKHGEI